MDELDGPWKEALDFAYPKFTAFFFPKIHKDIDWSIDYEPQDQELQKLAPAGELGVRRVDKLVKVHRLSGDVAYIHAEVQAWKEDEFPWRMYVYNYRAEDRYTLPVVSVAILGDDDSTWRPKSYKTELWGCSKTFNFLVVKLLSFKRHLKKLEADPNPFALLTLAHLQAMATRNDPGARQPWKLRILKGLYQRGLDRVEIRQWYRILDWILALPPELERQVTAEVVQYEQENQVAYVTSAERIGIEKGLLQGKREGRLEDIEHFLRRRFGAEGLKLLPAIQSQMDLQVLTNILEAVATVASAEELRKLIPQIPITEGTPPA